MKMTWANATIEELTINQTLGGGATITEHDGVYNQTPDGLMWEGYEKLDSEGK